MPRPKFQCRTSPDTIVSVERFKAWFFVNRTQPCSQSTTLKFGAGAKSRMLVCNGGVPQPCRIFGWKTNVYIHIMCIQTGQKLNHNSRVKKMDFALARPCKMTSNASSEIHWFSMVCFQKPFFFSTFSCFFVCIVLCCHFLQGFLSECVGIYNLSPQISVLDTIEYNCFGWGLDSCVQRAQPCSQSTALKFGGGGRQKLACYGKSSRANISLDIAGRHDINKYSHQNGFKLYWNQTISLPNRRLPVIIGNLGQGVSEQHPLLWELDRKSTLHTVKVNPYSQHLVWIPRVWTIP